MPSQRILIPLLLAALPLLFCGRAGAQTKTVIDEEYLIEQHRELLKLPAGKPAHIQIDEESVLELIDRQPSFSLYKDNYFTTGIPLDRRITKTSADVKFQLSIRQRLTQSILPWKTFLYLGFTQRVYWHLYDESSPFADINLNPEIALSKNVIVNNKLYGFATLSIEHESNGKGDTASRSWNYVALSYSHFFNPRFSMQGKLKIPFWLDRKNTPRFPRYRGVFMLALNYQSANERFSTSAIFNFRKTFGDANITFELSYKINKKANQFAFMQLYTGYAEDMINYTEYKTMIRFGFNIKPRFGNVH